MRLSFCYTSLSPIDVHLVVIITDVEKKRKGGGWMYYYLLHASIIHDIARSLDGFHPPVYGRPEEKDFFPAGFDIVFAPDERFCVHHIIN